MTLFQNGSLLLALAMMASDPAEAIEPYINLFVENPLEPIVHGVTNLPDGSELMLTLTLTRPDIGYSARAKVRVAAGRFTTENFSVEGRPLNPGLYKIKVSIGGRNFEYVTQRQLGGPENASLDAAAKARAMADLQQWLVETCTSNIDVVNAAVRSGIVTGHEILGAGRQAKIDACTAAANSRSMK